MNDARSAAAVLTQAADLLERDGWRRRAPGPLERDTPGPRCVAGAIAAALDGDDIPLRMEAYEALAADLGLQYPRDLIRWNNEEASDRGQVVRALRRTARRLEAA